MTGKWVQTIPDLFNPDITQPIVIKEVDDIDKDRTKSDIDKDESRFNDEDPHWKGLKRQMKISL